ncbi:uncharacterized protein ISCGN_019423 [Ixodes scapularis]
MYTLYFERRSPLISVRAKASNPNPNPVVSCALLPRQPHPSSWSVFEVLDISVGFTRFCENGEISDVHRALFKNCNPSNVVDFERRTAYKVSWDGDANTRGGYYDAEILELTGDCVFFTIPKCDVATSNRRFLSFLLRL